MSDEINKEATVEPSKVLPIDIVHEMKKSFPALATPCRSAWR